MIFRPKPAAGRCGCNTARLVEEFVAPRFAFDKVSRACFGERMRLWLCVFPLLSATACSTLISGLVTPPKIESSRVDLAKIGAQAIEADVVLNVRNPNSYALPVEKIAATLEVDGAESLDFSWSDLPELKPGAVTAVRLPVKLPWGNIGSMALTMLKGRDLPYVIKGSASLKGFAVPFEKSGTIPLPKSGPL